MQTRGRVRQSRMQGRSLGKTGDGSESDSPGAQTDSLPTDRMLASGMVWAGEARPQKGNWREKGAEEDEEQGIPSPLRPRLAYLQMLPLTLSACVGCAVCLRAYIVSLLRPNDSPNQQNT